jgi:CDP-diacylglycerol--glycerol-3-phosphate 3-phosphatidyltransferase
VALEQGYTAFGEHSMMQSRLGKYLVASRFSRFAYALSKAVAFAFLIVAHIPEAQAPFYHVVGIIGYLSGYSAVALCLIRGIPVIIESKRFFPGMR